MIVPAYGTLNNGNDYFFLLNFARITRGSEGDPHSIIVQNAVLEALNSFSESLDPAIRPILPLIYRNTGQSGLRKQLHPKVQSLLRDKTLLLIAKELANRQWLIKHIEIFQKANIPIILLKGLAFAGTLYPENAPRLGVDLDILVTQDDFEPACKLLSKTMNPVLLSSKRAATHEKLFERVFSPKEGTRPTVELHRDLTNPSIFNIDQQSLWGASRKHPIYNSELVRILSPEDTLLHLAVHAFRDLDFCTHNLLDAHEVWCQWRPDPNKLLEFATQWGAKKVLFFLLENCREIMETPIPTTLLDSLEPSSFSNKINKKILQSSAQQNARHPSWQFRFTQLISQLLLPDSMTRGLRFQIFYLKLRVKDLIASFL
jgi:hypothetical protein